jgi:hypothetical protein
LSKKQDHPLLQRLLTITEQRLPLAPQMEELRQQRQWLIDLDHLLEVPEQTTASRGAAQQVAQAVRQYLSELTVAAAQSHSESHRQVVAHFEKTFHSHWWGLFECYAVAGVPRTNNDLEQFFRRLKEGQRRITGRKNIQEFILRYGPAAACLDYEEGLDQLLARLRLVSQADFLRERQCLTLLLRREQKQHRFRHHRPVYLHALEVQWSALAHTTE